jgi:hypothetical protein
MKSVIVVSHVPTLGTLRLRSGQAMGHPDLVVERTFEDLGHPPIKFIRTEAPKMYDR